MRSALRGAMRYMLGKRGERRIQGWLLYYRMRVLVALATSQSFKGITRFKDFWLWADSEAFPRVKKLIKKAQHTVIIQMFIWKDDELGREIASVLTSVADRGVKVYITKEAVGDFFEMEGDFITTKENQHPLWRKFWTHPNIRISHTNNNDHAKVYIIDDEIMLLSGMNIANEYHESWHDYMVEIHGTKFVQQYLTFGEISGPTHPLQLVMNTERVKEIRPCVMQLLADAKRNIVIEQCYISDPLVIEKLIERTKAGVEVTIITPSSPDIHYYSNMQAIAHLMKEANHRKLSVFLHPKIVHGKIILVDRKHAFVGSANLMTSSLDDMGEVNVLVHGKTSKFMVKLKEILRKDILASRPLKSPPSLYFFGRWLAWLKL